MPAAGPGHATPPVPAAGSCDGCTRGSAKYRSPTVGSVDSWSPRRPLAISARRGEDAEHPGRQLLGRGEIVEIGGCRQHQEIGGRVSPGHERGGDQRPQGVAEEDNGPPSVRASASSPARSSRYSDQERTGPGAPRISEAPQVCGRDGVAPGGEPFPTWSYRPRCSARPWTRTIVDRGVTGGVPAVYAPDRGAVGGGAGAHRRRLRSCPGEHRLAGGEGVVGTGHRGVVRRRLDRRRDPAAAAAAISLRAAAMASTVSGDSVSVGSIISASSTTSGKYTVGAWNPWSSSALATSIARTPVARLRAAAEATNSCMHGASKRDRVAVVEQRRQVAGVEHRSLGHPAQARSAEGPHVGEGPQHHEEVAVVAVDPADRVLGHHPARARRRCVSGTGPGRNGTRRSTTATGPAPGPPPPWGVAKVLWRLEWTMSKPMSPGRTTPRMALRLAPS